MLRTCLKDEQYALISIEDILSELTFKDSLVKNKLLEIYHSNDFDENGNYRFKKNSKLYRCLKKSPNIINGDNYINLEILSRAFLFAYYECNYEILKKLKKYCRYYMDSIVQEEGNDIVKNMILSDEKVMKYITRFESLDDFIKYQQGIKNSILEKEQTDKKIIPFKEKKASNVIPLKEEISSRSFVKIG